MKQMIKIIFLGLALSSPLAYSSPLDDARASGAIVELASGYVEASSSASAANKALAADVNKKRKAAYRKIADKNGVSVDQVAKESYRKRTGG